jgi:DNA-directed RNA polymerase specialized sigma24 family protein
LLEFLFFLISTTSYFNEFLYYKALNYDKKQNRLAEREIPMSDLPQKLDALAHTDGYFQNNHFFEVSTGETIVVKDDEIARMIIMLPVVQREIILLSYFTDMTDSEIGRKLSMAKSTVQGRRKSALKKLKNILED